jgi:hypothetical protein
MFGQFALGMGLKKKSRKLRDPQKELASTKTRSLPLFLGYSEYSTMDVTPIVRFVHYDSYTLCALAREGLMSIQSFDAPSVIILSLPQYEARIPKDVHPFRQPQSHISSDLLYKETYMCS